MYITVIQESKNTDLCISQLVNLKGTHQNGIKNIPIKKLGKGELPYSYSSSYWLIDFRKRVLREALFS